MNIETSKKYMTVFYVKATGDITDIVGGQQNISNHYGTNAEAFRQIMDSITVPVISGVWAEPDQYKVKDRRLIKSMPTHYEITADGDLVITQADDTL